MRRQFWLRAVAAPVAGFLLMSLFLWAFAPDAKSAKGDLLLLAVHEVDKFQVAQLLVNGADPNYSRQGATLLKMARGDDGGMCAFTTSEAAPAKSVRESKVIEQMLIKAGAKK